MLNVIITVDAENPQTDYRNGLVNENLIDPVLNNENYGVSKLAKIFENYSARGVFFMNTSEKNIFDASVYKNLCNDLSSRGHEIAIHSHPEWITNDSRVHMWELNFKEQLSVLNEMKNDITSWTGQAPTSHRAGAYGINLDTFKALKEIDIKVDSSLFAEHSNCKVQLTYNNVIKINDLLEVPVTGFHKIKRISFLCFKIPFKRLFIKTDIETCELEELKWFLDECIKNNYKVFNLFMHSYSLFNIKKLPKISKNLNEEKLSSFLAYVRDHPKVKISTFKEYYESKDINLIAETIEMDKEQVPFLYEDFSLIDIFNKILNKFIHK